MQSDAVDESLLTPIGQDPTGGVGVCLSGGGYRAMLFHLGTLEALNRGGLLPRVDRFSAVSGGSIPTALLGLRWRELLFDSSGRATNFKELVADPIRRLARITLDIGVGLAGLIPGIRAADRLSAGYARHLFGDKTLADLPADHEGPRFVLNAASLQTGSLVRFSRPFVANWQIGVWRDPHLPIADAVAASSAFPPFFSPLVIDRGQFETPSDAFVAEFGQETVAAIQRQLILTDGGVYDNFGLETVWKKCRTVIVSDGGQRIRPEVSPSLNWFSQLLRIRECFDDQARVLRIRWMRDLFDQGRRRGAYFSVRGEVVTRSLWNEGLGAPPDQRALALIPTRLAAMPTDTIDRLVVWGSGQCDAALTAAAAHGVGL